MVNAKEKRNMMDFIVGRLEIAHNVVRPQSEDLVEGGKTNYILVDRNGAVILVDRPYTNDSLKNVRKLFRNEGVNIATVFYKDGKTFFRSAAREKGFKSGLGLSLKNYNTPQVGRMIMFRPEESYVFERGKGKLPLQYYQPGSRMLDEAIVSLEFNPAEFDYSHINAAERFRPEDKESKRLYIWSEQSRIDMTGDLHLSDNLLLEA